MNQQFFATGDQPVDGPPREIVGYGEHPPKVAWPGGARVAVQIVVNYEEGSEKTFAMGDGENDILYELPFKLDDQRDLAVESMYEYGTRAGIWRLFRVFDAAGIPVTFFAAAVALERNIEVAKKLAARGDEAASHGFRWSNHFEMTRDEEREAIKRAISVDRADGGDAAARLVLPRDEREHARAGRRGGRVPLRLRLLQRRPAVLVARQRQAAPGGAVRAGRQRRALRPGAGLLEPGDFFEMAKAHSTGSATTATT